LIVNARGFFHGAPARRALANCLVAVCACCLTLFFSGCDGSSPDSAAGKTPEKDVVKAVEEPSVPSASGPALDETPTGPAADQTGATETPPEHDLVIGDSGGSQMYVTNALGTEIVSLSARRVGEKKFGGVMKAADLSWPDEKTALLQYDTTSPSATGSGAAVSAPDDGGGYPCDIRLKMSDGSRLTLHAVDLNGPAEITVRIEDGVAFVAYLDADGKEVSTYEAEKALKEAKEKAAAEKEAKETYKPPTEKKKKTADDECVDDIILR
jgi:hypothetical protein